MWLAWILTSWWHFIWATEKYKYQEITTIYLKDVWLQEHHNWKPQQCLVLKTLQLFPNLWKKTAFHNLFVNEKKNLKATKECFFKREWILIGVIFFAFLHKSPYHLSPYHPRSMSILLCGWICILTNEPVNKVCVYKSCKYWKYIQHIFIADMNVNR